MMRSLVSAPCADFAAITPFLSLYLKVQPYYTLVPFSGAATEAQLYLISDR
jgi:hypothetical protein